jgi:hypothetical protein
MDASNLLKPALVNRTLTCIGSTTYKEYRTYLEKDSALARRFQKIDVKPPSVEDTVKILEGLQSKYEEFHGVKYSSDSLRAAVELSDRFIQARPLPDKAIDVIDEAGARLRLKAISQEPVNITTSDIEKIVASIAQVPAKSISAEDKLQLKSLEFDLKSAIFGQDKAIEQLVAAIKLSRAGLGSPTKPIGCFLFTGPTGVGKTEIMKTMAVQDIVNGEGVCVVDPHGDFIEDILPHVPAARAEDVIVFEPSDLERPMGLNMLEVENEAQKDFAVQEMISIFYKLVTDPAMLGPMFEHNMRNAMLTLMADEEHPGTLVEIPRIFTDTAFQKYKVSKLKDPLVRAFWEKEMAKTSDFHKSEMLGYLISKVGRFVENGMMRNIVGQPRSSFNFRKVMDEKKILLVNLSKGRVGELNAKLLGLILVSKIQMAALSRADIREEKREDFYLYVDEFQNFITDAFESILSEARKYRLNLVIAHQYLAQLEQGAGAQGAGAKSLRDAVFGNAGTMVNFRIGVEDAESMAKEMSPTFNEFDLVNVERFNAYIKLMIQGTASKPFNMATYPLPKPTPRQIEIAAAIKDLSRLKFGRPRASVEAEIMEASMVADMMSAGPASIEMGL